MGLAAVGAGEYGAGAISSGYGQQQGLRAMEGVWNDQGRHAAASDDQIRQLTAGLLSHVGVQAAQNQQGEQALRSDLDTVGRNTVAGAKANLKRRGGKMGAEGQARTGDAFDATGIQAHHMADFMAALQAYRGGAQNIDNAGRQFALDRNGVVQRQREWQGLAPLQVQAAGMQGAGYRRAGTSLQALGQGTMHYAMSRPQGEAADGAGAPATEQSANAGDLWGTSAPAVDPYTGLETAYA